MRQKYFIAVCDILGFSALVQSTPLDRLVDGHLGWFRRSLHHSLHKTSFPDTPPPASALESHALLGVAWFSDTVLLYTRDDSDEAVRELIATVGWLIFEGQLGGTTRIRAGLAYGDAHIDPAGSIYVGKPIVEAHQLETAQQWSGAALTPEAVERVLEEARTGKYADWWLVPWDVPLKNSETIATLAVNWNLGLHHPGWKLKWSKDFDDPPAEAWASDRSICEKFANTKRFHEAHCRTCSST